MNHYQRAGVFILRVVGLATATERQTPDNEIGTPMSPIWPIRLLDHLELVDTQEAPHGLYGIRRAHAPEGRLPTAAFVLGGPGKAGLLTKSGFSVRATARHSDTLSFNSGVEAVSLRIFNYATTKVRHYGSAFRIDKRHTRQSNEPSWDLETLVPKLRTGGHSTHSILLIAHSASIRDIKGVLGMTTDPVFLGRYALAHYTREWDDRYARGFRTALHLWVPRVNNAEPGAATNDGR